MRKAPSPEVRYWLNKIAEYEIPRGQLAVAKVAAASQAGNDVPFEMAFSNLAHAYLRDSAPTLLDHEIGFQLLDRNEDNNKAIGVFGFRVGSSLLLAPVFFLNGNLKGHELLYLKNQDVFVPLQENWINDIINKKPNIMGSGVGRNTSLLGMLTPDLSRLSQSPSLKMGSFRDELAEAMPALAAAATTDIDAEFKKLHGNLHLPTFLKQAGLQMLNRLVETFQDYPEIGAAFDRFHGLNVMHEAIKAAGARERTHSILSPTRPATTSGSLLAEPGIPHPIKTGALKIMTYDSSTNPVRPAGVSEEEAEQLARDKLLIKDERKADEVSVAYSIQVEQKLQNPQETGLYDILVSPHEFEKCLVVVHPASASKRLDGCTVIRLDGEPDWINCGASAIWCGKEYDKSEFKTWFESLSEPGELSKGYTRYILIGPNGEATAPFRVRGELGLSEDDECYDVDFDDTVDRKFNTGGANRISPTWGDDSYDRWADGQRIHLNAKQGERITSQRGDVYVPKGFKLLKVESSKYDLVSQDEKVDSSGSLSGGSKKPPINPGNLADVQLHMFTQNFKPHSAAEKTTKEAFVLGTPKQLKQAFANEFPLMTLKVDGPTVTVNERSMHHRDALIHLVRDHGFREKAARELMGRAQHRDALSFYVKYGYAGSNSGSSPYLTQSGVGSAPYTEPQPESGNFMHDSARTRYSDTQINEVPGLQGWLTNPQVYNPNPRYDKPIGVQDSGGMQQAGDSNQAEIFDASAIGSMLKAVRDDTMIDRYIGPLTKGLDSLGRILFAFYWHGDRFAERFGKQDMPELEDALRNSFEGLGDCVIFLKQKSVEPYPEEQGGEVDLSPVAGN